MNMKSKNSILLAGAGKRCRLLCRIIRETNYDITVEAVVDNNSKLWGTKIDNVPIVNPTAAEQYKDTAFCITVSNSSVFDDLHEQLVNYCGFSNENEVLYFSLLYKIYKSYCMDTYFAKRFYDKSSKDRKIIFDCCNGLGLGGVEAWTIDICTELTKKNDFNAVILCGKNSYITSEDLENKIDHINIIHDDELGKVSFDNMMKYFLNNLPCTVVINVPNVMLIAAAIIKELMPTYIKIISVIHNDHKSMYDGYTAVASRIDYFVCVSQDIKNTMVSKSICLEKMSTMTCPFACEKNLFREYTENIDMPLRIGYAGRLDGMEHSQKRMDLVLRLIDELNQRNIAFFLEIAGAGSAREEMEDYIKKAGLERYVTFLGTINRTDIPAFWKRQDIGINLSDFEGRSISQLEAMANGVVLVVTEVSGVKEDITNGENGYYVPVGDYQAAADRIEYLYKHRSKLRQLGEKAHADIYPKSCKEMHIDFWLKILGN